MTAYYVVYKGEEVQCVGDAAEIAEKLGISEASVRWLSTPSAKKRAEKSGRKLFAERVEVAE